MKDNKTEKLMNEITKAFDMLRGSLHMSEAFKIVFVLLHYKRFNDIIKNCEGFDHCVDFIPSNEILPEEYRWQRLNEVPADQIFTQIDTSLFNIYSFNNTERFGGTGKSLNIQKYQSSVPATTQKNLVDIFSSQDFSLKGLSHKDFEYVVWQCEEKYINTKDKVSYTPLSLSKLIVTLFNIHRDERIYIPFCGFGNLFITTIDHAYAGDQCDENYDIDIYLNEKNEELLMLQELRFSTAVVSNASTTQQLYYPSRNPEILLFNIKYLNQNISEIQLPSLRDTRQNTKADIIFLNPPFGIRQPDHLPSKVNIDGCTLEIPKNHGEILELLHHLQKLSEHGRMCVVLPFGTLFRGGKERDTRKFLTENDYLEAVFQLPEKLFPHTHISTAILVINKNKPKSRKHKTLFVKVESALVGNKVIISDEEVDRVVNTYNKAKSDIDAIVTLEEIQQQDYDLSPGRYIGALSNEIKELIETKAGRPLGDICNIIRGQSRMPAAGNNNGVPFITTKNLAKDVTEPFLDLDNVHELSQPICIFHSENHVINFDKKCVLVSLVGNDLKPTIFDPDYDSKLDPEEDVHRRYTSIVPGSNIAAIFPDEGMVDFEYFYYQLYSAIVKKQLNSFLVGAGIPHINISSLNKVVIPVLKTQEEQRAFAKQQKLYLLEIENKKLEVIKVKLGILEEKQEAEFEIVRHLAHDIKPKINMVKAPIMTISAFLDKEGLLDKEVSARLDGTKVTARDDIKTAIESLSQITNVLDSARDIVTREIRKEEFLKTKIFILFENKIVPSYENKPYKIIIECKDKEIEVSLHEKSFIEAINNIIRNAETHAFSDDIVDPELRFEIYEDIKEKEILIDYTNNGHPFPSSMTENEFMSFGKKSKNSKGEGLGGAWIKRVIDAHDGSFEIIRDRNPVHFRITFPKRSIKKWQDR